MSHSCEMFLVVCPEHRPAVPEDEQCESPARALMEIHCRCAAGVHTVWFCADHYDWLAGIFEAWEKTMKENL